MAPLTTGIIAQRVSGQLVGPADLPITGIEALDRAGPEHIVYIREQKNAAGWDHCPACAALVQNDVVVDSGEGRAVIKVPQGDLALIVLLNLLSPPPAQPAGVHASAAIDPTAELARDVVVGPGCSIGPHVRIAAGTVLHANVTILDGTTIGSNCLLYPGVVIRERCTLGARVIIHPNAVIGADGFGYRPAPDGRGLLKVPQIGTVIIGDDVEIGAGSCVDRGTFSATMIGAGTKIDNLCQIAHNCRIGRCCLFAAHVGLAGSVIVGDGVMLGGKVGVRDNVTIGAGAKVAACACVAGDVPPGASWGGIPAEDGKSYWRKQVTLGRLPEVYKKLHPFLENNGDARPS